MACGCARRMREWVLPFFGYILKNEVWYRSNAPNIPDAEVEEHYSWLTARIVGEYGLAKLGEVLRWQQKENLIASSSE